MVGIVQRGDQPRSILSISPSKQVISSPVVASVHPVIVGKSISVDWGFSFDLPSHGEAHGDCGSWRTRACLNVGAHHGVLLDGTNIEGKAYVERYQKRCFRPECPICYNSWASREAGRIEHRFLMSGWIKKVKHVVVSPPKDVVDKAKSYEVLKKEAYRIAKKAGFEGGCVIPHAYSRVCGECGSNIRMGFKSCLFCGSTNVKWSWNFHFHMLGYGWIEGTKEIYEKTGWIVKNLGIRKSVFATAMYQLTHAGIREGHHCVTWFGNLSYNNLKVPVVVKKKSKCPACGNCPQRVVHVGKGELPEVKGSFWADPNDFVVVHERFGKEVSREHIFHVGRRADNG